MNLKSYIKRYRTKYIQKDNLGNLYCYKCTLYKPVDEFDNSPQESDVFYREGKDKRCKCCKKDQYLKRRLTNRGRKDLNRLLLERWHGAKDRAKKNNLEIDFDIEYLRSLWDKQNGKCAISGLEMTYEMFKGRVPTNISVDRIDSSKGYIKGNVQLVCMAVNQMKNELSLEDLLYFCDSIIKNINENKNK